MQSHATKNKVEAKIELQLCSYDAQVIFHKTLLVPYERNLIFLKIYHLFSYERANQRAVYELRDRVLSFFKTKIIIG